MVLEKVSFSPSDSVCYMPDETKQQAVLTVNNDSNTPVTYKMKSTRPGVYKMRPVYGLIQPGETVNIRLIYKGLKPNMAVPLKDRFTVIYTIAPSSSGDIQKLWTQHKYHSVLAGQELKKKKLKILYQGYNDQPGMEVNPLSEASDAPRGTIKKGFGLVDEEDQKGPAAPGDKRPVIVMYREHQAPMSDSGSEGSDDDKTQRTKSAEQSTTPAKTAIPPSTASNMPRTAVPPSAFSLPLSAVASKTAIPPIRAAVSLASKSALPPPSALKSVNPAQPSKVANPLEMPTAPLARLNDPNSKK